MSIAVLWWLAPSGRHDRWPARDATPTAQSMDCRPSTVHDPARSASARSAVIAGGIGRLLQQPIRHRQRTGGARPAGAASSGAAACRPTPNSASRGSHRSSSRTTTSTASTRRSSCRRCRRTRGRLKIDGLVDNPMELTFDDLLARPQVERYITLVVRLEPGRRRPRRQRAVAGRAAQGHPRGGRAPGRRRAAGQQVGRRLDVRHAGRGHHGRPRCDAGHRA